MRRHDEGWWKYKAQSCQPEDCCIPLGSFVFCDLFCSVFIHWLVSTKRTLFDVRQNGSVIICPFTTAALHISRVHGTQCDTELSWTSIDTCVTRLIIAMIGATLTALTNLTLAALDTMGMGTGWPQPCFTTQLQQPSRDNRCHYEKSGKQFKDAQSFEFHPNPISGVHCFLGNRQTNDWLIQHWQPSK